jgi:hypothetical protein
MNAAAMKPGFLTLFALFCLYPAAAQDVVDRWREKGFSWTSSGPMLDVGPGKSADPHVSVKDPSFVFYEGAWHLFTTLRMKSGRVDMEYFAFKDWKDAQGAERHVMNMHNQYNCAPQVFYFTPHKRWYMVYQRADSNAVVKFGPCFSTTEKIGEPKSWTKPLMMITNLSTAPKWIDFWVICDDAKAYMFYTSNDGHMWRRETAKSNFPYGWSEAVLALKGDIFEASHTYKIKGTTQYLTVIEAIGNNRRYYKAYVANKLDGEWLPVADTIEKSFAAAEKNVRQEKAWTTNISHGELVRSGIDEYMEIDPAPLKFVYQGAADDEYRGRNYGQIPWRLGMLEEVSN